MMTTLRRDLNDRAAQAAYLAEQFPSAAAVDARISPIRGGYNAALARLQAFDVRQYSKTRNYLTGEVSRLSPYIRHGILTPAQARDTALKQVKGPQAIQKFIQELAWHDYFRRVHLLIGDGVWRDIEDWKTGHDSEDYAAELPEDIARGETGIAWIDRLIEELHSTGYLHNHARMWLSAYVVHWRRVRWQAGAKWFLQHLIDGDPASNNLSWQWVTSTFGAKPYFYNLDNVRRYTGSGWRDEVETQPSRHVFDMSYEDIAAKLFPKVEEPGAPQTPQRNQFKRFTEQHEPLESMHATTDGSVLVWLSQDWLGPGNPAWQAHPGAEAVFVFDRRWIEDEAISLKRLQFLYETCLEREVTMLVAEDPAAAVLAHAQENGAQALAVTKPVETRAIAAIRTVETAMPVQTYDAPAYLLREPELRLKDLQRFSRYWRQVDTLAA